MKVYLEDVSDDMSISYDETVEVKEAVFRKLIDWYKEQELFSGESICQSDRGYEHGVVVLGEIADDIIKFDLKYDEE